MSLCLRCGYDLRATPPDAPCPECGLAAHRSVFEHFHPDDCPPAWVQSIALGSLLLLLSYLAIASMLMSFTLTSGQNGWGNSFFDGDFSIWELPVWVVYGFLAASILHLIANLILMRDERRRNTFAVSFAHRFLTFAAATVPVIGLALATYWQIFPPHHVRYFRYEPGYWQISDWLVLPLLACPSLTFFRLRQLSQRLLLPRLAEHVTIVAVGSITSLILLELLSTLWHDLDHANAWFILFMALPWALVWLFNLWATALLFVVVHRFQKSAKEARDRWKKADASVNPNAA